MGQSVALNINAFQEDVERLHSCTATFLRTDHVVERFQGQMVWEGDIHTFEIDRDDAPLLLYLAKST